jgi:hypothetical protein
MTTTITGATGINRVADGADMPAGSVLQVQSKNYQGAYSTTSGSWVDVTNFSVIITPSSTSSKILVNSLVQLGSSGWAGINVVRKVTGQADVIINQGNDTVGGKQNSTYGSIQVTQWGTELTAPMAMVYLDSPSTTSAVTYQVQVVARWGTTAQTVYINRPHAWNNDSISGRVTSSNIVVQEIAG